MTRVGLVLGAGGVAGQAFHAGVLGALGEDAGFDAGSAEVIVGTSAGSIAAALLRAGRSGSELLGRFGPMAQGGPVAQDGGRAPVGPDAGAHAGAAPLGVASLAAPQPGRARIGGRLARLVPAGRRSPGGIITMVRGAAGETWPGPATWICAVRRRDGRRVVFGQPQAPASDFPRAVAASCAIPGYFAPVVIGDEPYVDGGAHSPTNLDLLTGLGLDLVLVSSPMSVSRSAALGPRVDLGARLLFRAGLAREARPVRKGGTTVVTLQPTADDLRAMGLNAMDTRRVQDIEAQARTSTRNRLADGELRRLLSGG